MRLGVAPEAGALEVLDAASVLIAAALLHCSRGRIGELTGLHLRGVGRLRTIADLVFAGGVVVLAALALGGLLPRLRRGWSQFLGAASCIEAVAAVVGRFWVGFGPRGTTGLSAVAGRRG